MKDKARQFLKSELVKRDINYVKLAKLMNDKGFNETPDTIRSKIHRGTFSFSFVLEVCASLNINIILKENN